MAQEIGQKLVMQYRPPRMREKPPSKTTAPGGEEDARYRSQVPRMRTWDALVYHVLGKVLQGTELRELLIQAIRYGDRPEVRARPFRAVYQDRLRELIEERALAHDSMDASRVRQIREDMERAATRRLQAHFIGDLFLAAFQHLGGTIRGREARRYEISHVPAAIPGRDRLIGKGNPVLNRYERRTFEKELMAVQGKPLAEFVCPGHPLLDATIDLILERHRDLLKGGTVLVDESDPGVDPRVLYHLEHSVQDARTDTAGNRRVISRQVQFIELGENGTARTAGYAPYLDYRPLEAGETETVAGTLNAPWLQADQESRAVEHAITQIVPRHFDEIRRRKEALVDKTMAAVKDRLTKEINYWDYRSEDLRVREAAGRVNARLNSAKARRRADDLQVRLECPCCEAKHRRGSAART